MLAGKPNLLTRWVTRFKCPTAIRTLFTLPFCPEQGCLCRPPELPTPAEMVLNRWYQTLTFHRGQQESLIAYQLQEPSRWGCQGVMRILDPAQPGVPPGNSRLGTVYWREACSSWFVLCTWPLVSGWNLGSRYGAELFPHLRGKVRATVWHDAAGAHHQSLAGPSPVRMALWVIKWACLEKWSTVVRIIMLPAEGGRPVMKSRDMWVQCCCPGRLGPLAPSRKRSEESCGHGTGSLTLDTHLIDWEKFI